MASGIGSFRAWSKPGALMMICGSSLAVTGVFLSSTTKSNKAAASNVKGAPRLRNAWSGSSKEDRVVRV
jgi:hypothetical protein